MDWNALLLERPATRWRGPILATHLLLCFVAVTGCGQLDAARDAQAPRGRDSTATQGPYADAPLRLQSQGSFFVGGRDVRSDDLSTLPVISGSGTIAVDQVYVRYQVPAAPRQPVAVALIHGCCLTGKTWETTPDGRMGWDEFLLRRGYPVYVVDQAWRGRSAANPAAVNAVKAGRQPPTSIPTLVSAGREVAWEMFRFGPKYPQAHAGVQFPLDSQAEFWKQMVPDWAYSLPAPNPTVPALRELVRKVGPTVLVSHSQSGIYPFQAAALDATGIAAIVAIEPGACPAATADMAPYRGLPVLVLFGDFVGTSAYWNARLQSCRAFANAANAAGGRVQVQLLPDAGFSGNTHMLMQDKNSLDIAAWLAGWIERSGANANASPR